MASLQHILHTDLYEGTRRTMEIWFEKSLSIVGASVCM